jgi:hypothetical protein
MRPREYRSEEYVRPKCPSLTHRFHSDAIQRSFVHRASQPERWASNETQSEALHPSAASLVRDDEDVRGDMAYFRKLGIPYEPKSLVEVLTCHKPKSAMPIACHSLADMRAKEAIPVLKSLADFPIEDVKATSVLAVARLCGKDETPWLVECLTRKG